MREEKVDPPADNWILDSEEFLSDLASRSARQAEGYSNPNWQRAYLALSDAADRLHAMTMRLMVKE